LPAAPRSAAPPGSALPGAALQGAALLSALAGAPLLAGALAVRPAWRIGLRERLGARPAQAPGSLWVHAASVGEVRAATPLLDRLRAAGHRVVASTTSVSGRDLLRRVRPEIPCHLAPLDHPWCVAAALGAVRPAALVLVETELWPCWIRAADRRGIPVALVSGRLSDRAFARYRGVAPLFRGVLRRLAAVGARSELDRERFLALGADPARVSLTGDLKAEAALPEPLAPDLERALAGQLVFAAGSTHAGEEEAALGALAAAEARGARPVLALAPRRLERVAAVLAAARAAGRRARCRSELGSEPLRPGEVLVLDRLGELPALYGRAQLAFVGGTLVPVGGHNLLEPAVAGCPVLFGPHTESVRDAAALLEACGAARRVADAGELACAAAEWLCDPAAASASGEAGQRAVASARGGALRAAALVEALLA
jgi:3-deoxy-D-manno-octulosonic-acid transferase